MFFYFWQKFENSKWPPFLGRGNFFENCHEDISQIPWGVEKFDEIALSCTVKEIEENLYFSIFGKNSKIQNGRHFWGGENFLKIATRTFLRYHGGDENFDKIALSHTVKDIEENLCFAIFGKNSKIQNGRHVWGGENFLKIEQIAWVPCGLKISTKSLYLARLRRQKQICVFHFLAK